MKVQSCFSNRALVKAIFEALTCLQKKGVFVASELVSTKTLLPKHDYRRQDKTNGKIEVTMGCGNLLSGPNSNHRLETTVWKPPFTDPRLI